VTVTATNASHSSKPLTALVVGFGTADRLLAVTTLSGAGFDVTTVDDFEAAKARLAGRLPSVLLTAVRLGEYNGLHLVLQAKTARPEIAALVTIEAMDPVLEREAEQLGATFIVQPASARELLAAVVRTCLNRSGDGVPVRAPFERRSLERRVSVAAYPEDRRARERRRDVSALLHAPIVSN
jgi:DNA-binding NtrC family response regulator